KETLIYSKTQLLPPDKSRPPERCRDEKSNKSAPP
ncbi:zinc-dependent metalloprotease, partial [Pseudomonas cannabina]